MKRKSRIDTERLRAIPMVGLAPGLRRPVSRRTQHIPCPKCGGKDRFAVKASAKGNHIAACNQCTVAGKGQWMDTIGYMQWLAGCGFAGACRRLGALPTPDAIPTPAIPTPTPSWTEIDLAPTIERLTLPAYEYLRARGISPLAAREAGLGLMQGALAIPYWQADGRAPFVKLRTLGGAIAPGRGLKYWAAAGSRAGALFCAKSQAGGWTSRERCALLVESELDAVMLAGWSYARDRESDFAFYAVGGTQAVNASDWMQPLADRHRRIYSLFDNDDAGRRCADSWPVERIAYPGKDPGELVRVSDGLIDWSGIDDPLADVRSIDG